MPTTFRGTSMTSITSKKTVSGPADDIVAAVENVLGAAREDFVPLHAPLFRGREKDYVLDCIETGWVSSVGAYVDRFEKDLADYLGVKRAVAVVNGTAALHLCLIVCGVKSGDEVLCPALTFVATANAISYTEAVPHFCDVSDKNMGLCPEKLAAHLEHIAEIRDGVCINKQTGRVIRAVVPMHCYGHPVDMDSLCRVAAQYHIAVIEDAAESLGSLYNGKHTGHMGRCAAISFNGNKIITTGGGGAVVTNDEALADMVKHLSTTAKVSKDGFFMHDRVGYNYRMPNINAALGCAQLEALPEYIAAKRKLAQRYADAFADMDGVSLFHEEAHTQSNYWLCAIRFEDPARMAAALDALNAAGLMSRPLWELMHTLPMYGDCPRADVSVAQDMAQRILALPSSVCLV